jgi:hypothetical protein
MKFAAGYLLGATTVVGIIGAFGAGIFAMDYVNDVKKASIAKVEETSISSAVRDIMNARKN